VHLENGLVVTAPAHPVYKLERGMKIECLTEKTFRITNIVRNAGDLIYSGGVWSLACSRPEGKVLRIPLGEDDEALCLRYLMASLALMPGLQETQPENSALPFHPLL